MSQTEPPSISGQALFAVFTEIMIIEHLARNYLERALPDGLKISHFGVLNHMVRLGDGQNPVELARAFQVQKGAMTNTLQKLEARNLIKVLPNPSDGRGKRIFITAAGRQMRERALLAALAIMTDLDEGATLSGEMVQILPVLRRLRSLLDDKRAITDSEAATSYLRTNADSRN